MTSDKQTSNVISNRNDVCSVQASTKAVLKKESHKRWRSKKETTIRATTAKIMRSTQQMGLKQTVTLYGNEIEVMATAKRHCSFCNDEHGVNTCGKLKMKSTTSKCYNLSSKDSKQMIELKDRLRVTIPIATEIAPGLVFGTLDS